MPLGSFMTTRTSNFVLLDMQSNNRFSSITPQCLVKAHNSNQMLSSFVRTLMKGGPGYTKFAHGRYKLQSSKYAYFWYTFLCGGLVFLLFFDLEGLMYKGSEPVEKMHELKTWYSRTNVPKAKELTNEQEEEKTDTDELKVNPKSKASFRNRKVRFATLGAIQYLLIGLKKFFFFV